MLPARTNPNHASLLTGAHPDGHGIVDNKYWNAARGRLDAMDEPGQLEMESIFTMLALERPELRTAAFFAKGKLRRLFSGVGGRQRAPTLLWEPHPGFLKDGRVMAALGQFVVAKAPHFSVTTIADVDRMSHAHGPGARQVQDTIARVDVLIAGFVEQLRETDTWTRTVVIVTADHGFAGVAPERAVNLIRTGTGPRRRYVAEGMAAFVHLDDAAAANVNQVARDEERRDGVARVVRNLEEYHVAHPRAGQLLLLSAPGRALVQGPEDMARLMIGNHGGIAEQRVPMIILGGHVDLRPLASEVASLVDVVPTVAAIFNVRVPRRLDGRALPPGSAGRALPLLTGQ